MKAAALLACLLVALLAGCGSKTPDVQTKVCPDGKTVTATSNAADGQPVFPCAPPTPPSIRLGATSYTVAVYHSIPITWTITPGNHTGGHAMIATAKLSHHSVPTSELGGPGTYGVKDLGGGEVHQNLPQSFNYTTPAGAFTQDLVGTRYLRVYAQIRADDLPLGDYWSDEVVVNVTPIQPTGKTWTLVHGKGDSQGGMTPNTVSAKLGDGISFQNDDVVDHKFTETARPACAAPVDVQTVKGSLPTASTPSTPFLVLCPGTYSFQTDDVQPIGISINAGV